MSTARPRPASPRAQRADGVPGHVRPALDVDRAVLGVRRAALEVATARRRLALAVEVAEAAGARADAVESAKAVADEPLPTWLPTGGGPAAFG